MGITIRIKERGNIFTCSASGKIERVERVYEEYPGRSILTDYPFRGHDDLPALMTLWTNRPTYKYKTVVVEDMDASVLRRPATIKFKVFDNENFHSDTKVNVGIEKIVSNNVWSVWSNVKPYFDGELLDYEIEPQNTSTFHYSQHWGKSSDWSKTRVLTDPAVSYHFVRIKPRKTLNVELNAIKTTVTLKIKYRCFYDGVISYSYETINAEFYTNPEIKYF